MAEWMNGWVCGRVGICSKTLQFSYACDIRIHPKDEAASPRVSVLSSSWPSWLFTSLLVTTQVLCC